MNEGVNWIYKAFLGGVFNKDDRDNGGPECASYLTFEYRLIVTLCIVNINY